MQSMETLPAEDLLSLARQGDPQAIAQLLNREINQHDLDARVTWREGYLWILVESAQTPDRTSVVACIRRGIEKLKLDSAGGVRIFGRRSKESTPQWTEEIEIGFTLSDDLDFSLVDWLSQGHDGLAQMDGLRAIAGVGSMTALGGEAGRSSAQVSDWSGDWSNLETPVSTPDRLLRICFNQGQEALLPVVEIKEILRIPTAEILPVPDMPECVLGIYNTRGDMVWLVDLGLQLGFESTLHQSDRRQQGRTTTRHLMTVIVQVDGQMLGLVVLQVMDIESYNLTMLKQPDAALFPAHLTQFMQSYVGSTGTAVLDVATLLGDPRLRVHDRAA